MSAPRLVVCVIFALASFACGGGVVAVDASVDSAVMDVALLDGPDAEAALVDVQAPLDVAPRDVPDGYDGGDAGPDRRDASEDGDGYTLPYWGRWDESDPTRLLDPADASVPATVGRSCGTDPSDAWQCEEVHFRGGRYLAGSTDAYEINMFPNRLPDGGFQSELGTDRMRDCEVVPKTVRSGYVDAYEVTVARFRRWVAAGMPHPPTGREVFPGTPWENSWPALLVLPNRVTAPSLTAPQGLENGTCTWTPSPGPNEARPINCVTSVHAAAFCDWDGKHLISEAAWEFLATNSSSTVTPLGAIPATSVACGVADLGQLGGPCGARSYPETVDAFPGDVTRVPSGVQGLMGGVSEWVLGNSNPNRVPSVSGCMLDDYFTTRVEEIMPGPSGSGLVKGGHWNGDARYMGYALHAASRRSAVSTGGAGLASPSIGFRCARWEGELH